MSRLLSCLPCLGRPAVQEPLLDDSLTGHKSGNGGSLGCTAGSCSVISSRQLVLSGTRVSECAQPAEDGCPLSLLGECAKFENRGSTPPGGSGFGPLTNSAPIDDGLLLPAAGDLANANQGHPVLANSQAQAFIPGSGRIAEGGCVAGNQVGHARVTVSGAHSGAVDSQDLDSTITLKKLSAVLLSSVPAFQNRDFLDSFTGMATNLTELQALDTSHLLGTAESISKKGRLAFSSVAQLSQQFDKALLPVVVLELKPALPPSYSSHPTPANANNLPPGSLPLSADPPSLTCIDSCPSFLEKALLSNNTGRCSIDDNAVLNSSNLHPNHYVSTPSSSTNQRPEDVPPPRKATTDASNTTESGMNPSLYGTRPLFSVLSQAGLSLVPEEHSGSIVASVASTLLGLNVCNSQAHSSRSSPGVGSSLQALVYKSHQTHSEPTSPRISGLHNHTLSTIPSSIMDNTNVVHPPLNTVNASVVDLHLNTTFESVWGHAGEAATGESQGASSSTAPPNKDSAQAGAPNSLAIMEGLSALVAYANPATLRKFAMRHAEEFTATLGRLMASDPALVIALEEAVFHLVEGSQQSTSYMLPLHDREKGSVHFSSLQVLPVSLGEEPDMRPALMIKFGRRKGTHLASVHTLLRDRQLMARVPMMVMLVDTDLTVLHQNPPSIAFLGSLTHSDDDEESSRNNYCRPIYPLHHPEHWIQKLFWHDPAQLDAFMTALAAGKDWQGQVRVTTRQFGNVKAMESGCTLDTNAALSPVSSCKGIEHTHTEQGLGKRIHKIKNGRRPPVCSSLCKVNSDEGRLQAGGKRVLGSCMSASTMFRQSNSSMAGRAETLGATSDKSFTRTRSILSSTSNAMGSMGPARQSNNSFQDIFLSTTNLASCKTPPHQHGTEGSNVNLGSGSVAISNKAMGSGGRDGTVSSSAHTARRSSADTGGAPNAVYDVRATFTTDPGTLKQAVLLVASDVTAKVAAQKQLEAMLHTQKRWLHHLYPRHVLDRVVAGQLGAMADATGPVADDINNMSNKHEQVTVMFACIAGFDEVIEKLAPHVVVEFLNKLFAQFDALVTTHQVYKVETKQDSYIIAGGLMIQDGEGVYEVVHAADPCTGALAAFHFAQALIHICKTMTVPGSPSAPLQLQIGLHTGPLVSGVVGQHMPWYCLFGDTMNMASRMHSSCPVGGLQLSADTYTHLVQGGANPKDFMVRQVDVKGKGLMTTYLLNPRLPHPHASISSVVEERTSVVQDL